MDCREQTGPMYECNFFSEPFEEALARRGLLYCPKKTLSLPFGVQNSQQITLRASCLSYFESTAICIKSASLPEQPEHVYSWVVFFSKVPKLFRVSSLDFYLIVKNKSWILRISINSQAHSFIYIYIYIYVCTTHNVEVQF